jgi:hypothetical protein
MIDNQVSFTKVRTDWSGDEDNREGLYDGAKVNLRPLKWSSGLKHNVLCCCRSVFVFIASLICRILKALGRKKMQDCIVIHFC